MANIKCDLWCKHQINGICNKIEINIDDMQFSELNKPKCGEFDSTKADCYACDNCMFGDVNRIDFCLIDGHTVTNESKCNNDQFSFAG